MAVCTSFPEHMHRFHYFPDFRWDIKPLQRVDLRSYKSGRLQPAGNLQASHLSNAKVSLVLTNAGGEIQFGKNDASDKSEPVNTSDHHLALWEELEPMVTSQSASRSSGSQLKEIWQQYDDWVSQTPGIMHSLPPSIHLAEMQSAVFDSLFAQLLGGGGPMETSLYHFEDTSEASGWCLSYPSDPC